PDGTSRRLGVGGRHPVDRPSYVWVPAPPGGRRQVTAPRTGGPSPPGWRRTCRPGLRPCSDRTASWPDPPRRTASERAAPRPPRQTTAPHGAWPLRERERTGTAGGP